MFSCDVCLFFCRTEGDVMILASVCLGYDIMDDCMDV